MMTSECSNFFGPKAEAVGNPVKQMSAFGVTE